MKTFRYARKFGTCAFFSWGVTWGYILFKKWNRTNYIEFLKIKKNVILRTTNFIHQSTN